jgi:hypothetical protein
MTIAASRFPALAPFPTAAARTTTAVNPFPVFCVRRHPHTCNVDPARAVTLAAPTDTKIHASRLMSCRLDDCMRRFLGIGGAWLLFSLH